MTNEPVVQTSGTMVDEIRGLYAYNRWANDRILGATSGLTDEELTRDLRSSFPSIRATLVHMIDAEWIWLSRWRGTSPAAPPEWDASSHAAIRARFDEIDRDRAQFLATLDDDALHRVIAYRTLSGSPFTNPLWQLMRHAVNHATYHRGQVTTMLRQLGKPAVSTDMIQFYRDQ